MRIVFVAVLVAVLAGCSSTADDQPSIIVPQGPGEQAQTVSPDDFGTDRWVAPSEADLKYVAMMIVHHKQALEMSALAAERAQNQTVRGLASRIHDTQGPEIGAMEQWQRQYAESAPGHGHNAELPDVSHESMPGMATAEQMAALKAATGAEFDRLFLQLMIAHHEGAVTMAIEVLSSGTDVRVEEMANDVAVSQTDEVERMKALVTP
ncbi:DUF305 domain-containing protein [Saccharothrix sp. NRRL B-16314]|uniref:DUF305 domain-containing protein n=1 Tax=Saccharothrix sp. NRRL B-16314 TaxID=1463825 RepID=UPI0005240A05|nr:DUF305 domain-containing protein [Saccharothrix sp. NRRL B-16314]